MQKVLTKFVPIAVALTLSGTMIVSSGGSALQKVLTPGAKFASSGASLLGKTAAPGQKADVKVLGNLPITFEANKGQTAPEFKFLGRLGASSLFLNETGAVTSTPKGVLRMQLQGASETSTIEGIDKGSGQANYFIGNKPAVHAPMFSKVAHNNVYAGIDMLYYGSAKNELEYDFKISPGADPSRIQMKFEGARNLRIAQNGDLVFELDKGEIQQAKPVAYQLIKGKRQAVTASYDLTTKDTVGFRTGAYDPSKTLVIDPILYSSFLDGGVGGSGQAVKLQPGCVSSCATYMLGGPGPSFPGIGTPNDISVAKLNPAGNGFDYATYFGGSGADKAFAIAVDGAGNAYFAGTTNSTDFPLVNEFQNSLLGVDDAFIAKLNPAGSAIVYSSYFGGTASEFFSSPGSDWIGDIALDSSSNVLAIGGTFSTDLPVNSPGALQETNDATLTNGTSTDFVAKISFDGTESSVAYATYLGGSFWENPYSRSEMGIEVDGAGKAYVAASTMSTDFPVTAGAYDTVGGDATFTAYDGFVAKLDPNPSDGTIEAGDKSDLLFSTYLGTSSVSDWLVDLALDPGCASACSPYVIGYTPSHGWPATAGVFQPGSLDGGLGNYVITKLNPTGTGLVYSTYLGGDGEDLASAIDVDTVGNLYVVGASGNQPNFPLASPVNSTPPSFGSGGRQATLTKLNPQGTGLVYSTYLGGTSTESGADVVVDASGRAYVAGTTASVDFPTTADAWDSTGPGGYLTKFTTAARERLGDFNANGATDLALYRAGTGTWYVTKDSLPGPSYPIATSWGGDSTDKAVSADYDGDGHTDPAVYRGGTWYINTKSNGILQYSWGGDTTDIPVPADYDGDGDADIAVYRKGTGTWYVNAQEQGGGPADISIYQFGGDSTDKPVPGDYDGDGDIDVAVYRGGTWYINLLEGGPGDVLQYSWGGDSSDRPVPGDWDGDGDTDVAVYRATIGYWYVNLQEGISDFTRNTGETLEESVTYIKTDEPGNNFLFSDIGKTITGTNIPPGTRIVGFSSGTSVTLSQPATADGIGLSFTVGRGDVLVDAWGGDGTDKPEPADWDRDGDTDVAVYRGGTWYINRNEGKPGDITQHSWGGDSTDVPVVQPHALR